MGRIFVCGDIHHENDIAKIQPQNFTIQKDLTKEDVLIVAGDWGGIWYNDYRNKNLLDWWELRNFTTLVVLGNHENYDVINKLRIIDKFGGKVRKVSDSVFIAERGEIYTINGKKILTLGGAESIDKQYRVEGYSWWEQESITQKDFNNALNNLERYNYDVDYFITHTGGSEVVKFLGFNIFPSDKYIDFILNSLPPRTRHYCGHYHVDMVVNLRSKILYDSIIELT